ncbi:HNH endonuclease signature motif containing protein [Nocardioides sp. SYSU D00038]|uniref:HNH endonuclease signature motif containing protein n=1 Tax=Nocardioides sp. SYSU D00038 TaxID=2812554 RepID=UPI001966D105|nr:HNH endonuclease signature motif containing protein [Nocardioides sp. SYSU D00038]
MAAASVLALPAPLGAVAEAAAGVQALPGLDWEGVDDDALVEAAQHVVTLRAGVRAVEARLLAQVERRDLARTLGWGSTADWWGHTAGLRHGAAKQAVEHAVELVGSRPETLSALVAGTVSPEQSDVVLDAVDRLPGDDEVRGLAERVLLDQAAVLTATDLARTAERVAEVVDPDGSARAAEARLARLDRVAHHRRHLTISEDGAGGVRIKGRGTVEDAGVLRAALLPLTTPQPEVDLTTGEVLPDPRDFGVRMWDALVRVAQHSLDTDLAPEAHGARPRVVVTTELAGLRGEAGRLPVLDDGSRLSAAAVRRIACDCDVIPAVLGTEGEVLDVGRRRRLVTTPIWQALVLRDHHCAFPGCSRPPIMCHAHHIVEWAAGGGTRLSNLVMLCTHHHRVLHDTTWQVRIDADSGRPEFLPPGRDPDADWIRHRPRRE